jgi:hypothetical protein
MDEACLWRNAMILTSGGSVPWVRGVGCCRLCCPIAGPGLPAVMQLPGQVCQMLDELDLPVAGDLTVRNLRMASAITANASEPAEVIATAEPIVAWLAEADGEQVLLRWRLVAAYQQLDNQRGASCEVGRFLERAQELYAFPGRADTEGPPVAESSGGRPADM